MTAIHDHFTAAWTRNKSDELAVKNGCEFDVLRGAFAVWWIEHYCKLYEGEGAGGPLILRGCHECDYGLPCNSELEWDHDEDGGEAAEVALERARLHSECFAAGHNLDWQYECTMRMFSWIRWSEKWERHVRRFKRASIWIAKKNKKSPTLAAWSLYTTIGDGEPGQKVFLAAKDGNQAKEIAGKHVVEMLNQSEELSLDCQINKVTSQVTHKPSRSILRPLSSANSRTQESKEGLNGSVFIDETHVVDRRFARRINRAGISRSEPVFAEFSTAGNNPDGYGKEQFDKAQKVITGEIEDQGLFAAVYAAPQQLTEEELAADPLKYGRMANPAMGHTVDPEEFLEDYQRSKSSLSDLSDFLMYRLNVWQKTSHPWLRPDHWQGCYRKFTANDLLGRTAYAGLDLSRTSDMTSLVLLFPGDEWEDEERFFQLPFFWMPEEEAKRKSHLAPFLQWAKDGFLRLIPGEVVNFKVVLEDIRAIANQYDIASVLYDATYAEMMTQTLESELGIARIEFPQNTMTYAAPTADYERLVIAGRLHHNGHPVLTWQAGHVKVRSDSNGNKRPVKPSTEDYQKIDGIVAGIMGLAGAMDQSGNSGRSYYEDHDVESI